MKLTPEEITFNYNKFVDTLRSGTPSRFQFLEPMFDKMGERIAMAPASGRLDYHNAFHGGLVDHSLRVLVNALKLRKTFDMNISNENIIVTSLLHDIGKAGDLDNDYYIPQTSEWHQNKLGEMFITNDKLLFMPHAHRSVWLLQQFGFVLSSEEWTAILIHDGLYRDENMIYKNHECQLATLIHMADNLAAKQEKEINHG